MAYLTATVLNEAIGTTKVTALTGGNVNQLTRLIALATAEVRSALSLGGYTGAIPETVYAADASTCPDEIKLAAMGSFVELAYGANDLDIPEGYRAYIAKVDELKKGLLELQGVTRNAARAVGGIGFTVSSGAADDSSAVNSGSRPAVFARKGMVTF